ncbi:MAG: sel1 repeat family protein [Bacteroidetes bacterium]|nr:sel1 repeat family protein [Bacteroidota bacterium]
MKKILLNIVLIIVIVPFTFAQDYTFDEAKKAYLAKDYIEAMNGFLRAADKGNEKAMYVIGVMYQNGQGVEVSYTEAMNWYQKAADKGESLAMYNIGGLFYNSQGVILNYTEALNWYKKAADKGNTHAIFNIGVMYQNGQGVEVNNNEALNWFTKAADKGDPLAMSNIGVMYYNGQGVELSYIEALNWYQKAADRGEPLAMYNIGILYHNGQGVELNYIEALNWYQKAADRGKPLAMYNIGIMYYNGQGVELNYTEALNWFTKAADKGNANAMYNIGVMYYNGQGVVLNQSKATNWFTKAANKGNTLAIVVLEEMKKNNNNKQDYLKASTGTMVKRSNLRETELLRMSKKDYSTEKIQDSIETNTTNETIKNSTENLLGKDLKYRRSSLYTLMINDQSRLHANVILDAFGNSVIPQKFNDHNIGPYIIDGQANLPDQSNAITNYLNSNNIAQDIVAKWFNKTDDGKFNMDLIANRGMYDASEMSKVIASSSARGDAMLKDAGEELIGNTFIIVNDYKFTSKEEIAKKTNGFLNILGAASSLAGVDISNYTTIATAGIAVAGKGYLVKTTSYLYRLVWNEEAAAIFYNNYWTDDNNFDPKKVTAFKNSNNFKLHYVGFQTAGADIQSSIFTNKSEEELIRMATVKATDRAIAKLERQYEEFRTKTPLYSVEPLSAKIGVKEGLEAGDKFEVLQQEIDKEGRTIYKRVGIITVDGSQIWDNSLTREETTVLRQQGRLPEQQYTVFKGSGNYYPGQLIKQIN